MKGMPEERTILAAEYIIENKATVRSAAKKIRRKQKYNSQGRFRKASAP